MENINELKQQRDQIHARWMVFVFAALAVIAIFDLGFGQHWLLEIMVPILFIGGTAVRIRMAARMSDDYAIFQIYRQAAITVGGSWVSTYTLARLGKLGVTPVFDPISLMLYSCIAFVILLAVYDHFAAKGDAE